MFSMQRIIKKLIALLLFGCICLSIEAQDSATLKKMIDSLHVALKNVKEDTDRINILCEIGYYGNDSNEDLRFLQQAMFLSQKINYVKGETRAGTSIGNYYWNIANYPEALEYYLQSLKICEQFDYKRGLSANLGNLGNLYLSLGNFRKALDYSFQSAALDKTLDGGKDLGFDFTTAAKAYLQLNMYDSALFFGQQAYDFSLKSKNEFYIAFSLQGLGDIFSKSNNFPQALLYYRNALSCSQSSWYPLGTSGIMESMAEIFQKNEQKDSSIYYSEQALKVAIPAKAMPVIVQAATFLYNIYKHTDEHKSLYYLEIASAARDSIFNEQKNNQLEAMNNNEEMRQKDKEAAEVQYQNNLKFYGLLGTVAAIGVIALIQLRNNKQKKKANLLLQRQKQKVETTLSELKSTQTQLIQSEKMASLGELTAGIAHEIQNPLNFVNNFSEINKELIEELKGERQKAEGERNTILENQILNDIEENEEKINHHGKRADAIVKGMLQHSRSSTGQKELTDINTLADEYLRLAYHGLRAKDKSFNATMKKDFDNTIQKVNIIPQDIGRVILNLFNNAFYAVNERFKAKGIGYEPTVIVSTKKIDDKIEIKVKDNGIGIDPKVLNKIFQPFFTTKPAGQGTGLGLSLSYDIIKVHGGEIRVETKEGEGSDFIITLPA